MISATRNEKKFKFACSFGLQMVCRGSNGSFSLELFYVRTSKTMQIARFVHKKSKINREIQIAPNLVKTFDKKSKTVLLTNGSLSKSFFQFQKSYGLPIFMCVDRSTLFAVSHCSTLMNCQPASR